jgi:hypothetical protein
MFTAMQKHWVAVLILVGLAVSMLPLFVNAQELKPQKQLSDYLWVEVASGTVGAVAGGFIAAYAVSGVNPFQLFFLPCGEGLGSLICGAYKAMAFLGFLIGVPVGSTLGVGIAGSFNHVRGNILLAFGGAIAGEALGFSVLNAASGLLSGFSGEGRVLVILSTLVLSTVLGTTYGYNINATLEPVVLSPINQSLVLVGVKTQ